MTSPPYIGFPLCPKCLKPLYFYAEPTGFNPGFGQPSFGNGVAAGPTPQKDTNPVNVFAAMKAGTFANDSAPQSAGEAFLRAVDRGRAS